MAKAMDDPGAWEYETIVSQKDGRYYARIAELHLIVDAEDVAAVHARLDAAKHELIVKSARLGLSVPRPQHVMERRRLKAAVMPFLIKCAAVASVGAILIVSAGISVNYAVSETLRNATQKKSRQALEQIVRGLDDFARRDLTPDREERLRIALRSVVPVMRPFIEELRPLFASADARPVTPGSN